MLKVIDTLMQPIAAKNERSWTPALAPPTRPKRVGIEKQQKPTCCSWYICEYKIDKQNIGQNAFVNL